jgi:hypothetical protein
MLLEHQRYDGLAPRHLGGRRLAPGRYIGRVYRG